MSSNTISSQTVISYFRKSIRPYSQASVILKKYKPTCNWLARSNSLEAISRVAIHDNALSTVLTVRTSVGRR